MGYKTVSVRFSAPLSSEEIGKVEAIELIKGIEIDDDTVRINFDGEPKTSYQILRELVSLDFEIVSYNPEGVGLEDYYLSVMGDEKGVN